MPQIKINLSLEDLNEWARLANEREELVMITLSKFVNQETRKLTKRLPDAEEVTASTGSLQASSESTSQTEVTPPQRRVRENQIRKGASR